MNSVLSLLYYPVSLFYSFVGLFHSFVSLFYSLVGFLSNLFNCRLNLLVYHLLSIDGLVKLVSLLEAYFNISD